MATMHSSAPMPDAHPVEFQAVTGSIAPPVVRTALVLTRAGTRLRQPKEPLPVAEEVDLTRVQNAPVTDALRSTKAPPVRPPAARLASPAPTVTFNGGVDDGTVPPDTMGVVNRSFVFNPLNGEVRIFDRTGVPVSQTTLDGFWNVFSEPVQTFDPRAVYDPAGRRFIFVSAANAETPESMLLIAVSAGDDPTGNWRTGYVRVDPSRQGEVWLDFPSVGFSADKITVQVNLYALGTNAFAGSTIYVWDKVQFYAGVPAPASGMFVLLGQGATQTPAVTLDANVSTQYLVSRWSGNVDGNGYYNVHSISGSVSAGTVGISNVGFIQTPRLTWASTGGPNFAPQAGTKQGLTAGDDRVLSVVLRNGALWFSNAVFLPAAGPARTAAQWLQVRVSDWRLQQVGRVDDPSGKEFYAYPTIAVNSANDALIGFAHFSAATFASGGYALRRAADPAGTMRTPVIFAPGGNSYVKTFGGTNNRWGDYSSTQVDPADDLAFWTVQEFAAATPDTWGTKWARVR
jgi:hypothetical protein